MDINIQRITISANHEWLGKQIKDVEFPEALRVLVIRRGDEKIMPKGNTLIMENDILILNSAES